MGQSRAPLAKSRAGETTKTNSATSAERLQRSVRIEDLEA
jgi:hypothetical protein